MPRSRQLAAIMFTDIKGYTALMQRNEEEAINMRNKHRQVFNYTTEKYRGKVLQYYGDGTLSIFSSAIDAVHCGIDMQLGFLQEPSIPVRVGIHTGDIIYSDEEIIGDSVNVASRIESLAIAGSILISGKVYDEIKNQDSIATAFLKKISLKNVVKPIELYAITNSGLAVPNPYDIKGISPKEELAPPAKPDVPLSTGTGEQMLFLTTKLYAPPPRPNQVQRPRLIEQLNRSLYGNLTLVSAPAGFGKSTLVSEWLHQSNRKATWLSLGPEDADISRFLGYLTTALRTLYPSMGEGVLQALKTPQLPQVELILTALLNEISQHPEPFTLVLDDYHLIDSQQIDQALGFLLEQKPPQMHWVIITREDPHLPLARMRAKGQLTELRAAHLRFSPAEASSFLNQTMGLKLSEEDVSALESRTEGWIAGLQMAALSMQGRQDLSGFIKAFEGSHHFIMDYLVEEVLQLQPEAVRNFLLQTSILDRLTSPLCDEICGQPGSKELLESLERENLFVIPLDDHRTWYRFHHLFADVLKTQLQAEMPNRVKDLHLKASQWFENHQYEMEAIHHALEAEDAERIAYLVEMHWPALRRRYREFTLMGWLKQLPEELIRSRPVLCFYKGFTLLSGDLEQSQIYLKHTEKLLNLLSASLDHEEEAGVKVVYVNESEFQALPGMLSIARAYHGSALGDLAGSVAHTQKALELFPKENHLWRGAAAALLGIIRWAEGNLSEAEEWLMEGMVEQEKGDDISSVISCAFVMANIHIAQGRLQKAALVCEQAMQLREKHGGFPFQGTESLYVTLAEIHFEQGNTQTALQLLQTSRELGEYAVLLETQHLYHVLLSRIEEARGKLEKSLNHLNDAEKVYVESPSPNTHPIHAFKVRVWLKQGRLKKALRWIQDHPLTPNAPLSYVKEFEHITLARVMCAQAQHQQDENLAQQAIDLLNRLLIEADQGERQGSKLEIWLLLGRLYQELGKEQLALDYLQQALDLGEEENFVQVFLYEGDSLTRLFTLLEEKEELSGYGQALLERLREVNAPTSPDEQPKPSIKSLVEPLSKRELEILQLIAQGLSNQQISEKLFVALSTVKGHNRNIFDKLQVKRRTEAVAKARELDLI